MYVRTSIMVSASTRVRTLQSIAKNAKKLGSQIIGVNCSRFLCVSDVIREEGTHEPIRVLSFRGHKTLGHGFEGVSGSLCTPGCGLGWWASRLSWELELSPNLPIRCCPAGGHRLCGGQRRVFYTYSADI